MSERPDSKELEAIGLKYWQQFVSSKPDRNSYIGGFVVGVLHERDQMDARLAAVEAEQDRLRVATAVAKAMIESARSRLAAVEAERNRLREVCQDILGECPTSEPTEGGRYFSHSVHAYDNAMWTVGQKLRAALATPADAGECG
jgi:hypothetical protein